MTPYCFGKALRKVGIAALVLSAMEAASGQSVPGVPVTLVWDAGGRDVLDEWEHEWPYLHSLIPQGTWFENATIGSAPSDTPPIHGTIGTGSGSGGSVFTGRPSLGGVEKVHCVRSAPANLNARLASRRVTPLLPCLER